MTFKKQSTIFYQVARHCVTIFCLFFLLQLAYFVYKAKEDDAYVQKITAKDRQREEKYRTLSSTTLPILGVISLVPLVGVVGTVFRSRLATSVFIFSMLLFALPLAAFLFYFFASMSGFKRVFFSQAGQHVLFDLVGGLFALGAAIYYLVDLARAQRKEAEEEEVIEWTRP